MGIADIERLIDNERLEGALVLVLREWRIWRCPELADLLDALSARIASGHEGFGYQDWLDRASTYEPVAASALLATIAVRGSDQTRIELADAAKVQRAAIDQLVAGLSFDLLKIRVAAMTTWPPDPRTTWIALDWIESFATTWPRPHFYYGVQHGLEPLERLVAAVAAMFVELNDERARPRLEVLLHRSPGRSTGVRTAQRQIAKAALDALVPPPVPLADATIARVNALVDRVGRICHPGPKPIAVFAPDELWLEVAADPDADGPRQVLADALLEHDDPRGQVLAWQLGRRHGKMMVNRLIRDHWRTWLGDDIAELVMRRRSRFVRGMLESIVVGPGSMPAWRYDAAIGHRELLCVRTIRVGRANPPDYARLVASLPNVRSVAFDSLAMAQALAEVGPLPTVTTLENTPRYNESVADTFGPLARATPNLAKLVLRGRPTLEEIAMLQAWFPQLAELVFVHWPNDKLELQRYYVDVHGLVVTWMTLAEADACSG